MIVFPFVNKRRRLSEVSVFNFLFCFVRPLTFQMSFAADKLYNGYLRRNMPTIVSKVKVREIMIHLPCLTGHDRVGFLNYKDTEICYFIFIVLWYQFNVPDVL